MKDNLVSKINEYSDIIIAKHANPDWDAQGSAIGLREIIKDNFKDKKVYIVGKSINADDSLDDDKVSEEIAKKSLLITVDTANFDRIDFNLKEKVKEIFKVDHHINVEKYADNEIVVENSIACTEVITNWAHKNNLKISKCAASNLYKGLVTDSGRFLYRNVKEETFEAAKILLKSKINIQDIYDELYTKSLDTAKYLSFSFSKATFLLDYNVGYIKIDKNDYEQFNLTLEDAKIALSSLSGIKEIEVFFIAYEDDKGLIKVSLRSRNKDINKVAIKYNGGGHVLASGATLSSWSELDDLINDLKRG